MTIPVPQLDLLNATSAATTAIHRASLPGFTRWLKHVSSVGGCEHPIRLGGHLHTLDPAAGEILSSRSTETLPDGVIYVPCGDRRATVCLACSETYRADTYHLNAPPLVGTDLLARLVRPAVAASGVLSWASRTHCAMITSMGQIVSMLARPVYKFAEVDRLLRLTPGTAKRWIDGYERAGRVYDPVVRQERTASAWVTWGEFVETRLLSEFRSSVPMIKLRPVVEWLRARVDRDYPLAYARPFLVPEGKELLVAAQVETGLDEELWMVVPSQQGVLLTPTSTRFTEATYYPDLDGAAEHIIADPATPDVWLHPMRREGQPTVRGIRTETIAELVGAGEPLQFVADTYGFSLFEVEQAVTYETTRRRAA